jgi:hypothetical protein
MASARWSETDLATFQRNSGRGLPPETVKTMEAGQGVKLDSNGEPLPIKVRPGKKGRAKGGSDGIALTSAAHPPGLINKMAKAIRSGKLSVSGNKFSAERTFVDGIPFHSKLEGRYYQQLVMEQKGGVIDFFLRQVPLHLPGGVVLRVDFVTFKAAAYDTANSDINVIKFPVPPMHVRWIDTKGHLTQDAKNKIKQVKAVYGITIELVKNVRRIRT